MQMLAEQIVRKLQDSGFEAYFAGGAVRDMLLGKSPKDIDVVTSAKPDEVENIFPKTIAIGKSYGVIKVRQNDLDFDVATFRKESDYVDNRRPQNVTFSSAREDAIRRDFTVNGLFYDPLAQKVIDFVGGQEDLKKKTIRFIGSAQERISEDHLRLIRAIRFKIVLGFQYDPETFKAVRANHKLIKNVSAERIRDELNRILASPSRHQGLAELSESGLLEEIVPEIEALKSLAQPIEFHKEGDAFVHTYLALKSLPNDASLHLAWAVLLHDIGKAKTKIVEDERIIFHEHAKVSAQMASVILQRLKFSRIEIETICWLIANHMKIGDIPKMRPGKAFEFVTDYRFNDLIELARADSKGTHPVNLEMVEDMEKAVEQAKTFRQEKEKIRTSRLIDGDDLIELGFEPGQKFKEIMDKIEDLRIEGKLSNKDEARDYVVGNYQNGKN